MVEFTFIFFYDCYSTCVECVSSTHLANAMNNLTLKVLVATIDALGHF